MLDYQRATGFRPFGDHLLVWGIPLVLFSTGGLGFTLSSFLAELRCSSPKSWELMGHMESSMKLSRWAAGPDPQLGRSRLHPGKPLRVTLGVSLTYKDLLDILRSATCTAMIHVAEVCCQHLCKQFYAGFLVRYTMFGPLHFNSQRCLLLHSGTASEFLPQA